MINTQEKINKLKDVVNSLGHFEKHINGKKRMKVFTSIVEEGLLLLRELNQDEINKAYEQNESNNKA